MIGQRSFPRGGIHPRDYKELTNRQELWNASIPAVSIVPMQQHIGKPAIPQVAVGDEVREGMVIGKADGFVSVPVHSPVPGKVAEIRDIFLPNGSKSAAVFINVSGEFDRLGKEGGRSTRSWRDHDPDGLLATIADSGIVGMGGATFPTHVKFKVPKGGRVVNFIINGTECEPYLSADHRLMVERAEAVVEGTRIAESILKPDNVFIAIEANKSDALAAIRQVVRNQSLRYSVVSLAVKYPQGDEKQVVQAILGKEIPTGGLPLDIGVVVANVGTVHAMYEAVVLGKPLIERVVTVSGGAVRNPANLKVRIGTTFGDLFEDCGGFTAMPAKIIAGGPMMGFAVFDLDTPVTKGTSGVLALTDREVNRSARTSCLQCGRCVRSCPVGLEPTLLAKLVDHQQYQQALDVGLADCRECGICSHVCPARLTLVQSLRIGKRIAKRVLS